MKYVITEPQIFLFLRRRFSAKELETLLGNVKKLIEDEGIMEIIAVHDAVRELIKSKKFSDIDEFGEDQSYWSSYLVYEKPLVEFVKSQLGLK